MQTFYEKMNASPWKGVIHEVGIGLEFSSRFLRVPGASKTILRVVCDYAGLKMPCGMRAVSLENARHMAEEAYDEFNNVDRFGLAITGAHYTDRPSHAYVFLKTKTFEAYMHISIAQNSNREWVGGLVDARVQWFLNACLLSSEPWSKHIDAIGDSLETHNIDILYAPGMGDAERLLLLRPLNPLVYHKGQFQRVVDYLRQYPTVYPGSFNPPTKAHLAAGSHCLYEITQQHCYKPSVTIEDMLHRIRMLNAEDRPVLITQAPLFMNKHDLLVSQDVPEFTFIMGSDTWNIFTDNTRYPINTMANFLQERLPCAEFLVRQRDGIEISTNAMTKFLKWRIFEEGNDICKVSSTDVRNSDNPAKHPGLTAKVADYVKRHKLYS